MGNIVLLDDLTINQIAAGEVIERPASVIKEMLENSIDAGAKKVTIEVKNGGISLIRITDDGCGIAEDDMEIAFERHATSKIRKAEDLTSVKSMGFRGEALASIAAIAKVEMISKKVNSSIGNKIVLEGGNVLEKTEIGCPVGTKITVENLFYNTPVRYKFLKKDYTETGYIEDVVTRIALVNTNVAITLISNGKTILHTPGNGDSKSVIYSIYGKDIANGIIDIDYTYNDMKVTGVIGKPGIAKSNRSYQMFFVNNRFVKDKSLTAATDQAYRNILSVGKFGFVILNLQMDPSKVDVNVHPAKLEVRFQDESAVFKAIYHAIKSGLEGTESTKKENIKNETLEKNENVKPSELLNMNSSIAKLNAEKLAFENNVINNNFSNVTNFEEKTNNNVIEIDNNEKEKIDSEIKENLLQENKLAETSEENYEKSSGIGGFFKKFLGDKNKDKYVEENDDNENNMLKDIYDSRKINTPTFNRFGTSIEKENNADNINDEKSIVKEDNYNILQKNLETEKIEQNTNERVISTSVKPYIDTKPEIEKRVSELEKFDPKEIEERARKILENKFKKVPSIVEDNGNLDDTKELNFNVNENLKEAVTQIIEVTKNIELSNKQETQVIEPIKDVPKTMPEQTKDISDEKEEVSDETIKIEPVKINDMQETQKIDSVKNIQEVQEVKNNQETQVIDTKDVRKVKTESENENKSENTEGHHGSNLQDTVELNVIDKVESNDNNIENNNEISKEEKNINEKIIDTSASITEKLLEQKMKENMQDTQMIDTSKVREALKESENTKEFEEMYKKTFGVETVAVRKEKEQEEKEINASDEFTYVNQENASMFENEENQNIPKVNYRYVGLVFSTYFIVEISNEMYMIDYKSAKERIMYEKMKKNYYTENEKDSQVLLLPDVITLTNKELFIANQNQPMFEKAGFQFEEFGENTIKLNAVPSVCEKLNTKQLFIEILSELDKVAVTAKKEKEEKFISAVACKTVEKLNEPLEENKAEELLKELFKIENPFSYPYGKPIAIKMTRYDLERKFSRR